MRSAVKKVRFCIRTFPRRITGRYFNTFQVEKCTYLSKIFSKETTVFYLKPRHGLTAVQWLSSDAKRLATKQQTLQPGGQGTRSCCLGRLATLCVDNAGLGCITPMPALLKTDFSCMFYLWVSLYGLFPLNLASGW